MTSACVIGYRGKKEGEDHTSVISKPQGHLPAIYNPRTATSARCDRYHSLAFNNKFSLLHKT